MELLGWFETIEHGSIRAKSEKWGLSLLKPFVILLMLAAHCGDISHVYGQADSCNQATPSQRQPNAWSVCPQATCPGWKFSPSAYAPTSALKTSYVFCCTINSLQPGAPTSTGAKETFPCTHGHLQCPHLYTLFAASVLQLCSACKGLKQQVNLPQRHIPPTPMLDMGNVKHREIAATLLFMKLWLFRI